MIYDWIEKRKHPRFRLNCPVSFISSDKLRIVETSDLSLGGMKIQSRHVLLIGETYNFIVVIKGQGLNPKGRVIHIQTQPGLTYGVGVSFAKLSKANKARLNRFLSTYRS
jgi:hypothetical protein